MPKKKLHRVVSGKGTMADPFVIQSDLLNFIERIPVGGYDYIPLRITRARQMLQEIEVDEVARKKIEDRIARKEAAWIVERARYILRRAHQHPKWKARCYLEEARGAYERLQQFLQDHS